MMMRNNLLNMYSQFRNNPMAMLKQAYNIPQGIDTTNPNNIIQHLLDTGQVTQAQVNNIMNMRNTPLIKQLQGR